MDDLNQDHELANEIELQEYLLWRWILDRISDEQRIRMEEDREDVETLRELGLLGIMRPTWEMRVQALVRVNAEHQAMAVLGQRWEELAAAGRAAQAEEERMDRDFQARRAAAAAMVTEESNMRGAREGGEEAGDGGESDRAQDAIRATREETGPRRPGYEEQEIEGDGGEIVEEGQGAGAEGAGSGRSQMAVQ